MYFMWISEQTAIISLLVGLFIRYSARAYTLSRSCTHQHTGPLTFCGLKASLPNSFMFWGFSLPMATHFSRPVVIHHRIFYERVQLWKSGCNLLCRLPRAFEWLNCVQQKLQSTHEFTVWIPVVTICTASLPFTNPTFCPHSVFMCFVWTSEQTAIISLYNINWLVCITETECVYCAVRNGFLNAIQVKLSLLKWLCHGSGE